MLIIGGYMNIKKELKKNVKYIAILGVVVILYVLMVLFITRDKYIEDTDYLIIDDYLIWHKDGNLWYQVKEYNEEIGNNKFSVVNGNNLLTVDNIQYVDDKWYFFDNDYNEIKVNNFRYAYSGDENVEVAAYQVEGYSALDEIIIGEATDERLEDRLDLYRGSLQKIEYDFDNDGNMEKVYTFNDYVLDVVDYVPKNYLVFVKNNRVVNVLEGEDTNVFNFVEVLDTDFDGSFEIVVSSNVVNVPTLDSCYQIYKIRDDKLVLLQDCLFEE